MQHQHASRHDRSKNNGQKRDGRQQAGQTSGRLPDQLAFYTAQSVLSGPDRHSDLLTDLPDDIPALVGIVQNTLIYEHVALPFYGVDLPPARRQESHLRPIHEMLKAIRALDPAPLTSIRAPAQRLVGICRHFTLLLVSLLRHQGIPARARVGFGGYFRPRTFEDHWICEYWHRADGRWIRVDPQFDAIWCQRLQIRHDPLDLPDGTFLTAANAWQACRSGQLDAATFGIEFEKLRGLWFIAGSVIRDLAALNSWEMLAWDIWGAQPAVPTELDDAQLAFFDDIAALTVTPDASFAAHQQRYHSDAQLKVPGAAFNALRQKWETVDTCAIV